MSRSRVGRALAGAATLLSAFAACGATEESVAAPTDIVVDGLLGIAAALHDEVADDYLVLCAAAGDAPARIVRIAPAGGAPRDWLVAGRAQVELQAPTALALAGGELLVGDGAVVRRFDRRTGAPLGSIAVAGAGAIVDLSVAEDGTVWIVRSAAPRVVVLDAERRVAVVPVPDELGELGDFAAVVAQSTGGYVATRGGAFLLVDRQGQVERLGRLEAGGLSGLCRPAPGRWLGASRAGAGFFVFDLGGGPPRAVPPPPGIRPDRLACDRSRARLLVTCPDDGRFATVAVAAGR